ncbi:NAD(P)H-dependent oxidoreductase subunit E [Oerskovia sp. M15]
MTLEAHRSGYDEATYVRLAQDTAAIVARYPQKRSALLPMLHLVQSEDGTSPATASRSAPISSASRRPRCRRSRPSTRSTSATPTGPTPWVCTNTLCAVMGGDEIFDELSEHLGIGHDETTDDGRSPWSASSATRRATTHRS